MSVMLRTATLSALSLLFSGVVSLAQADIKLEAPKQIDPYKIVRVDASGDIAGSALIWDISDEDKVDSEELGNRFLFTAPPGTYQIKVRAITFKDGKTKVETAKATVIIGKPKPPDPTPPGPNPPDPPGPTPGPSPIPEPGFRVLMIHENAEVKKYPPSLQSVLYGEEVRGYCAKHCVPFGDGDVNFRCLDKDAKVDNLPEPLKTAFNKTKSRSDFKTPWLVVSNGTGGYSGPLPQTVAETMKILQQYGGQ